MPCATAQGLNHAPAGVRTAARLALAVFLLAGCVSERPTGTSQSMSPAGTSNVQIVSFAYAPPQITVARGSTVTWFNADPTIHTVTADNEAFDSGAFDERKTFQYVAAKAGTYPYFCRIHPFMKGTLVVTP